jgi:hypothetical protein
MAAQLHWYALWRCHSEVYRWADASTARAAGSRSPFYPEALASAAFGAVYRGDMQAAGAAAHAAFDAARTLPPVSARRPLEALAEVATFRGELAAAVDLYARAYDLSMGHGDFLDATWDAVGVSAACADADRLRQSTALLHQHLTDTEFGFCVERGEQMDGSQVIHFALEAITRAAAKP